MLLSITAIPCSFMYFCVPCRCHACSSLLRSVWEWRRYTMRYLTVAPGTAQFFDGRELWLRKRRFRQRAWRYFRQRVKQFSSKTKNRSRQTCNRTNRFRFATRSRLFVRHTKGTLRAKNGLEYEEDRGDLNTAACLVVVVRRMLPPALSRDSRLWGRTGAKRSGRMHSAQVMSSRFPTQLEILTDRQYCTNSRWQQRIGCESKIANISVGGDRQRLRGSRACNLKRASQKRHEHSITWSSAIDCRSSIERHSFTLS